MKYANSIHSFGAIVVILSAAMKIFHFGEDQINTGYLLIVGFVLGYLAQSWKIRLLEKELKDNKTGTPA